MSNTAIRGEKGEKLKNLLAVVADIEDSKKLGFKHRKKIFNIIKNVLLNNYENEEYRKIMRNIMPAITRGDSIEIVSDCWWLVAKILHEIMYRVSIETNILLKFRVGIGVGDVYKLSNYADESDGPAFWGARKALEIAERNDMITNIYIYYVKNNYNFKIKIYEAKNLMMYMIFLHNLNMEKMKYSYEYIWNKNSDKRVDKNFYFEINSIKAIIRLSERMCRY